MTTKEVFQKIQGLKANQALVQSKDPMVTAELDAVYKVLYKENIKKGCGDCTIAAFGKVTRLTEEQIDVLLEQTFRLKKGVAIQVSFGSSEMISNENLTDSIAIDLLRRRPGLIRDFAKYPKNDKGQLELPSLDEVKPETPASTDKGGKAIDKGTKGKGKGKKAKEPEKPVEPATEKPIVPEEVKPETPTAEPLATTDQEGSEYKDPEDFLAALPAVPVSESDPDPVNSAGTTEGDQQSDNKGVEEK